MKGMLLTVYEAAQRLKCHPHTVRRWIWSGRLGAVKVGDLVRVPEPELAKVVAPVTNETQTQTRTRPTRKHKPRGAAGLLASMKRWEKSKVLKREDFELFERLMAEGEQPPEGSDPLA